MAASSVYRNTRWFAMIATIVMCSSMPVTNGRAQRVAVVPSARQYENVRVSIDVENAPLITVLYSIARQAGLVPAFEEARFPSHIRVTLHTRTIAAGEAFRRALYGTGLVAQIREEGDVAILRDTGYATGTIVGRVTDAKTKQPLRGVKIGVDGVARAETNDDGGYRVAGVSQGVHTMTVKSLGYTRVTRLVTTEESGTVTVDVVLDPSATPLDQVVVTGTVIPTELKAVPSAITVITAKEIEQRGITRIDQLFRGDVPGLFAQNLGSGALLDEVTMFSRGATALPGGASAGTSYSTNPIKTYVDGVELADPKYLSQIDPKSIERIEILTGPQASTIYGSNAINGVMQVFTKRGTSNTPQLTLSLLSGWVENNFSNARTPQHDDDAQVSGIEGRLSYNAGVSWNYVGPWTPAKRTTRIDAFGGSRLEVPTSAGRVTADMMLRRSTTQNHQRGNENQTMTGDGVTGLYLVSSGQSRGLTQPRLQTLAAQTLGLTLGYAPTSWWSHEVGMGQDASDWELRYMAPGYLSPSDSALWLQPKHTDRRALRYTTTARVPVTSLAQATVTMGTDEWQNLTSSLLVIPQTLTGTLTSSTVQVKRQPGHNTGGFLQTQLGVADRLFFTYGLRAEWNPTFGDAAKPSYAPRYGVAYTQDIGDVTAKVRVSYGRSTRPPDANLKIAGKVSVIVSPTSFIIPLYGDYDFYAANPNLAPEHQQGGEGGLELYLGTRGSLVITHYNQTVDGLIAQAAVDSMRSFIPTTLANSVGPDGYGYFYQYQFLNFGSVRNQGWELQGSMHTGPLTTHGTYSWTKSRVIGVDSRYSAFYANDPNFRHGGMFKFLPEHTWAAGMTYTRSRTTIGLNLTGVGRATVQNDAFFYQNLSTSIRLPQNQLNVSNTGKYISFNSGYSLADVNASHRFSGRVEGVLQVQNLTDRYINDSDGTYASLGRQTKVGLRIRTR